MIISCFNRPLRILAVTLTLALLTGLAFCSVVYAQDPIILYVDKDVAGGNGDGTTWDNAFKYLQDALDHANARATPNYEIWVAEGVYYPDEDANGGHSNNNDGERFTISRNNVQLYGGFAGAETAREQRDWQTHVTILSGDVAQDDVNTDGNYIAEHLADVRGTNSSYSVLYFVATTAVSRTTVVDGFTITAGYYHYYYNYGGGIYCAGSSTYECSPQLANLTIIGNSARYGGGISMVGKSNAFLKNIALMNNSAYYNNHYECGGCGGGMYSQGNPTLVDITFTGNSATNGYGGALYSNGNPTLVNVTFTGNSATYGSGGALYSNGSPALINATFTGNSTAGSGGAIYNSCGAGGNCQPRLTNALFSGNRAAYDGGAIYNTVQNGGNSSPILTNVTIAGNKADYGGGMSNNGSAPQLSNVILWGNSAPSGPQIFNTNATPVFTNSIVQSGSGAGVTNVDPQFIQPVMAINAPTTAGDYRLRLTSQAINAGNPAALPADEWDLDGDLNTVETIPYDLAKNPRINAGQVDIGAYERQGNNAPEAVDDEALTTTEDVSLPIAVLANDRDPDGDALSVTFYSTPAHGATALSGTTTITYTPSPNFHGTDGFTYMVTDGGKTDMAAVTVTVTAVNDAPVAQNDVFTTSEDIELSITASVVLSNDHDLDGDALSIVSAGNGADGVVTLENNGTILRYTPDADFHGEDSFIYTITDGDLYSSANIHVHVTSVNDTPLAMDDAALIDEDSRATLPVLDNDSDPDGDTLSIIRYAIPAHGATTLSAANTLIYTPSLNFHGTDSFTYTVTDGEKTDTATAFVTVTAINDAPVAQNDVFTTSEDIALFIKTLDILTNDRDPDDDLVSVESVGDPANGTITWISATTLRYTPEANFHGKDSFIYTLTDGSLTHSAVVSVNITAVNDPPVANNDTFNTFRNVPLPINFIELTANDTDLEDNTLSVTGFTRPAHGTTASGGAGVVTYTPNSNFTGNDYFTYILSDGVLTDTATVMVAVNPPDTPPVAVDDLTTTYEGLPRLISVLDNDSDPDEDAIAIAAVSNPAHGTTAIEGEAIRYTPVSDFVGEDHFTYILTDGLLTDTATVSVSVLAINNSPEAFYDAANTSEDRPVLINLLANDNDPDGDTLAITSWTAPDHGSIYAGGSDSVVYTPATNFYGYDRFSYTISDGALSSSAYVDVYVAAVNDAPIVVNDTKTTKMGTPVDIPALGNDSDPDGDDLRIVSCTKAEHGTTACHNTSITYTPNAGFLGEDHFDYTVTDGSVVNTGAITVTVTTAGENVYLPAVLKD